MSIKGMTNLGIMIGVATGAFSLIAGVGSYLNSQINSIADANTNVVQRVSVVETKADSVDKRLERIENKLDGVLENFRKTKY